MFKSVFAKYVTAFTALLLIGVLLFFLIVDSVLNHYAAEAQRDQAANVAAACSDHITAVYTHGAKPTLRDCLYDETEKGYARRLLTAAMAGYRFMTVFVTDEEGHLLLCVGDGEENVSLEETVLPDGVIDRLRESFLSVTSPESDSPEHPEGTADPVRNDRSSSAGSGDETEEVAADEGLFLTEKVPFSGNQNIAFARPVYLRADGEGDAGGYLLVVFNTHGALGRFTHTALHSLMIAGLWLLLAALIALYVITERVISPLREMSRAARQLMVGRFDVRIHVRGKDEVAELATAFNQMAASLENLEQTRNAFVANVSHDLRTPMTTITGFIDGILDGVIPKEEEAQYLKIVSDEVKRLSRLVTELLNAARLQGGNRQLTCEAFDVCEMGRQILLSFEQRITDKHLDVDFSCDEDRIFVMADRDAIHQVIYNICDNAVKFSAEGGKLRMRFSKINGDGFRNRKVLVQIYNDGKGIPPEDLPFVFDRFYKSDKSRSLDKTGVGLGMFITKTIIDAHRETISVKSEYGKNCEFRFTLPRTDPPSERNAEKSDRKTEKVDLRERKTSQNG